MLAVMTAGYKVPEAYLAVREKDQIFHCLRRWESSYQIYQATKDRSIALSWVG